MVLLFVLQDLAAFVLAAGIAFVLWQAWRIIWLLRSNDPEPVSHAVARAGVGLKLGVFFLAAATVVTAGWLIQLLYPQSRGLQVQINRAQYNEVKIGSSSAKVLDLLGRPFKKEDAAEDAPANSEFVFGYKMAGRAADPSSGRVRKVIYVCVFIFNKQSKLSHKPCAVWKYI